MRSATARRTLPRIISTTQRAITTSSTHRTEVKAEASPAPSPPASSADSISMFSVMSTTAKTAPAAYESQRPQPRGRHQAATADTQRKTNSGKITPAVLCTQFNWPCAASFIAASSSARAATS
ncbi:hypothetical protein ACFFX0_23660 [Citricoccus parietis]|uniref:Uncharacterized protein n=1 Tax=Citricoccus parietis TaxID=592307 RepID=A0ABV5G506_9MICC